MNFDKIHTLSIHKLLFIQIIILILDKSYFPHVLSPEAIINHYMKFLNPTLTFIISDNFSIMS